MNRQVIILGVFILIISSGFQSVSAEIFFPSTNFRQEGPSTYCIVEPSESIAENQEQWVDLASGAVSDWEDKLKDAELENDSLWEMNQKIITEDEDEDCDIIIKFKDKPDLLDNVAGFFAWPPGNIVIYYLEYKLCHQVVSCYEDNVFKSNDMIYAIALHEIGHTLGLDHYISDDNSLNVKWQRANTSPPSIMIPALHQNPSLSEITDIDVQKVRSIYGSEGFYAFLDIPTIPQPTPVPEPTPVPQPTPVPEPTPVPTPVPVPQPTPEPKTKPIIPVKPFDRMEISHKVIEVQSYNREIVTISGQIAAEEFFGGQDVIITIHKPDQTIQVLKIKSTAKGYFETPLIFDKDSMLGTYHISASYVQHVDKDMDISFEVVNKQIEDQSISKTSPNGFEGFESKKGAFKDRIPVWVKHNTKGWADGHISDKVFISGIQYLMENKIIELSNSKTPYLNSKEIPQWVKNIAGYWTNGMITDDNFISSIQYLVNNKIINP